MICDIAHIAGMVAVGLHPSPVPLADAVTTTTHKTLRGPRSGLILCKQQHAKAVDANVSPASREARSSTSSPPRRSRSARPSSGLQGLPAAHPRQRAGAGRGPDRGRDAPGGRRDGHAPHPLRSPLQEAHRQGAEAALQRAHITTNKNMIPGDPEKPFVTSGLRLGTPALTTRGMRVKDMKQVARLIVRILDRPDDEAEIRACPRRGARARPPVPALPKRLA